MPEAHQSEQAIARPQEAIEQSNLPEQQRLRILSLASFGYSVAAISRETGHARITISKVLRLSGISTLLEQTRSRLINMGDIACNTVEYAIEKKRDPKTALAVLRGTGALLETGVQVNVNVSNAPTELADEYATLTVKPVESSE